MFAFPHTSNADTTTFCILYDSSYKLTRHTAVFGQFIRFIVQIRRLLRRNPPFYTINRTTRLKSRAPHAVLYDRSHKYRIYLGTAPTFTLLPHITARTTVLTFSRLARKNVRDRKCCLQRAVVERTSDAGTTTRRLHVRFSTYNQGSIHHSTRAPTSFCSYARFHRTPSTVPCNPWLSRTDNLPVDAMKCAGSFPDTPPHG